MGAAQAAGAATVHDEVAGNICYDWHLGDKAITDAASLPRTSGAAGAGE